MFSSMKVMLPMFIAVKLFLTIVAYHAVVE